MFYRPKKLQYSGRAGSGGTLLPSPKRQAEMSAAAMIQEHAPIPVEHAKALKMPAKIFARIQETWAGYTGPARSPTEVFVEVPVHDCKYGNVTVVVICRDSEFWLEAEVLAGKAGRVGRFDEQEDGPDEGEVVMSFPSIDFEPFTKLVAPPEMSKIWTPLEKLAPVAAFTRGKRVGPNAKCPCGAVKLNGKAKKFKHCCGRNG